MLFFYCVEACPLFYTGYYPRGEGAVRLARGNTYSLDYSSGRVQVYYNDVWGNVCRLGGFSSTAADVICHQTGWTGASDWSYSEVDRCVSNIISIVLLT